MHVMLRSLEVASICMSKAGPWDIKGTCMSSVYTFFKTGPWDMNTFEELLVLLGECRIYRASASTSKLHAF